MIHARSRVQTFQKTNLFLLNDYMFAFSYVRVHVFGSVK